MAESIAEFFRFLLFFTRPVSDYVLTFAYEMFMGKTKPLPDIENNILLLSAKELAEKIRNRKLKCEDVMLAYIERSKSVHPMINAVVDARYDEALGEARAIDIFLESQIKSIDDIAKDTPLLGVPFSCKEAIGVKDLAQTCGMLELKNRKAEEDSVSAAQYRKAGAIPLTVTNVPEACMWWETENLLFGRTKNPYHHIRSPGGSTGGEAALLTSAGAVIGIGNDLGGSIRIPAAFCGIYGHKPTKGLVSNAGFLMGGKSVNEEVDAYLSTGPICRYAEDLLLLMNVLVKDTRRLRLSEKVDFRKITVYYMEKFPGVLTTPIPDIKSAVRKAARYFAEEYEINPIELKIDELRDAVNIWGSKLLEADMPRVKDLVADESNKGFMWYELMRYIFKHSDHTFPLIFFAIVQNCDKDFVYKDHLVMFETLKQKFSEIFIDNSILLLPAHPEVPHHRMMSILKFENTAYTSIFNVLGYPVTSIPAGMSGGLPIGVQAVSGRNKDHLTIAAAIELDKVFGGWRSPSPITVKHIA